MPAQPKYRLRNRAVEQFALGAKCAGLARWPGRFAADHETEYGKNGSR
jgi:hypothetical protein